MLRTSCNGVAHTRRPKRHDRKERELEIDEYQQRALATDQVPGTDGDAIIVPLLGLAGEAGSLVVEYKKRLRDGSAHRLFHEEVAEELGDLLWYTANLASKFGLSLTDIAQANLDKTAKRWRAVADGDRPATQPLLFDEAFPESERFPREMTAEITESLDEAGTATVRLTVDGEPVGQKLRDNARIDDGYRFHDVLHLANVAMLGWSPNMRGLMHHKRKSDPTVDHVEDGGRAIVIDEGIVAVIFDYARRHDFLEGVQNVDYELLRTVGRLTSGLEVAVRSAAEWEQAILAGYQVWRAIRTNHGGRFRMNLMKREFELLQ